MFNGVGARGEGIWYAEDMEFEYIDAHGHLNDKAFDGDREAQKAELLELKIATIVVGTDVAMNENAIAIANPNEGRYAVIGQHPSDGHPEVFDNDRYRAWAKLPEVVAIGECGLDYYWPEAGAWSGDEAKEKKRQYHLFADQIDIARAVDKPLMIHGRPTKGSMDAYRDIIAQLKDAARVPGPEIRGNAHFFAGDIEIAKEFLDLGFTYSFTGVLTFTSDYDEVVRYLPKESLLAETDAPYVAPKPYRGKRNESKYVREVYAAIARIRGVDPEVMRVQLNENARRFFGI
jgi:TatD DNase family protein